MIRHIPFTMGLISPAATQLPALAVPVGAAFRRPRRIAARSLTSSLTSTLSPPWRGRTTDAPRASGGRPTSPNPIPLPCQGRGTGRCLMATEGVRPPRGGYGPCPLRWDRRLACPLLDTILSPSPARGGGPAAAAAAEGVRPPPAPQDNNFRAFRWKTPFSGGKHVNFPPFRGLIIMEELHLASGRGGTTNPRQGALCACSHRRSPARIYP